MICAQKELDNGLDMEHNYIYSRHSRSRRSGRCPATQQTIQTRCPEALRHAQSASGCRHRSSVSNRRFLRSRRLRAGQVRDASPRQSGQAVGEPISFGIRLLAPHLSTRRKKIFNGTVWRGYCPASEDPVKATNSHQTFWTSLSNFARAIRPFDPDLAAAVQKRFAITAHPRSIERALGRQEKKRR